MASRDSNHWRVRALNDALRAQPPRNDAGAKWMITEGVTDLGPDAVAEAIRAVREFKAFNGDSDPHGEHDFGSFTVAGERMFWKIDYYDRSLSGGSPDPANELVTCRVLTIMLALEY
jgi:hypothetical protein